MAVPFREGGSGGRAKPQSKAKQTTIRKANPAPIRPVDSPSNVQIKRPTSGTKSGPIRSYGGPHVTRSSRPEVPKVSGRAPQSPKKASPGPVKGYGPGKGGSSDPRPLPKKGGKGGKGGKGKTWTNNKGQSAHDIYREGMGIPQQGAPGPAAPAGPSIPDIEAYLMGDQSYQGGLAELMRALQQYQSQSTSQRGMLESSFQTAMQRMAEERTNALKDLEADFAARGLLQSGLYGEEIEDYDTQYQSRLGDLNTNLQNELNALGMDFSSYQGDVEAEKARLRQEAIARRASQYGLF